jgi:photosystem II stability/assembly factor-like uncharacterized protein
MAQKLLVGTSKGLVILSENKDQWTIDQVQFEGFPVSTLYVDERDGTRWVGLSHRHWGEKLHFTTDQGKSWHQASTPSFQNYLYRPGQPATLKKIWTLQHAGDDQAGCLWLGTEPGGLFFSNDHGRSWTLSESLWNHPTRHDDKQWFGAGKDFPFIHSIVVDRRNSKHVYIGVSCAGIFETVDGGKNWQTRNTGLVAAYLPNPHSDVGHDPHRLLVCPSNPDIIWQQNHCGIFRTINRGESWQHVSGKGGFPSYGFALAIDEHDSETAWVIPAQSDEVRLPVDLQLTVCKTTDGGQNWASVSEGLPDRFSFDLILRHAFVKKGPTLAFGSNNGNLYVSGAQHEKWICVSQNLAPVNCVVIID